MISSSAVGGGVGTNVQPSVPVRGPVSLNDILGSGAPRPEPRDRRIFNGPIDERFADRNIRTTNQRSR